MTLGAIFTPTLAAELKISLGSFSRSAYLRRSQLFFTRQVLLTSARPAPPVRVSFLPISQRCCYLIRALFVTFYWFLQVWWEWMRNRPAKRLGVKWKKKDNNKKKNGVLLCSVGQNDIFWYLECFPFIIHAWLVTAKKTVGVTVHFQNVEFIKHALFIQ